MKKYVITISILISFLIIGSLAFLLYKNVNASSQDVNLVKAKVNQELKYLDNTITTLMNKFHNISYANYKIVETEVPSTSSENNSQGQESNSSGSNSSSSNGNSSDNQGGESNNNDTMKTSNLEPNSILTNTDNKIDWNTIKEEVEIIYSNWPSILLDLNSLNINNDNLLSFTITLDDLTRALEDENEKTSLIKLADLYGLISSYLRDYSDDNMLVHVFATKSYVLRTYALAEEDNWNEMIKNITSAKTEYTNILNNSLNSNNINSINRGYILLNEMEKNLNQKDKNIFYINYKNLMQELDIIVG